VNRWLNRKTGELLDWARSSALRYHLVRGVCCADEFVQTVAARYDLERFGAQPERDHRAADVLVVLGAISAHAAEELERLYQEMPEPKWVMAVGTCACSGGVFAPARGGEAIAGISSVIPVDVFVPGCPPRPEAIIDGWILLQRKVRGLADATLNRRRRLPRESLLEDEWSAP
jgi:NADH-quinone oxidoreductase subunit B